MKKLSYRDRGYASRLEQLNRASDIDMQVRRSVRGILADVLEKGDKAIVDITNRYTSAPITRSSLQLKGRVKAPAPEVQTAFKRSIRNIEKFNKVGIPKSWKGRNHEGAQVGERYDPFERVGVYVPGGTAPLASTALMTVTLAKIAGVKEIVVCSPPPINPTMHYAIKLAGATEIYQTGGAQAIGAMAYGSSSIKPVQKIVGPGNAYVVEAKRQVFGVVDIDLLPGPSEVAVLADKSSQPAYVAADLLAQAEHGPGSKIFLVSPDKQFIEAVVKEIDLQMESLERQAYLKETLNLGAYLIHVQSLAAGIKAIEQIAPEHVSISCKEADAIAAKIQNCGCVFIGPLSPVACGDYAAGPSHTLPTGGAGKSFAGLCITDFFRRTSFVKYDRPALTKIRKTVETMAEIEGMGAHKSSVSVRFIAKKAKSVKKAKSTGAKTSKKAVTNKRKKK
ncbi:MAG: histidinol dehydrogenase [Verrucomicrobiota bacterium]